MGRLPDRIVCRLGRRKRPRKHLTVLSVACVTGSSKFPPAGETVPIMVTLPWLPSGSEITPARSYTLLIDESR